MNLTKNFASRRQSWRDSRQDRAAIFATVNLLLGENLGEIRGSIPARFWPPGLLLPGENLGKVCGRIAPRFWPPGFLLPGENLGEIRGRIPARFWPLGISFPGENLAGIPARFPPGKKIPAAKISPGSRQDPGTYFTRVFSPIYTFGTNIKLFPVHRVYIYWTEDKICCNNFS